MELCGMLLGAYLCGYGVKGSMSLRFLEVLLCFRALEPKFCSYRRVGKSAGTKYIAVIMHTP